MSWISRILGRSIGQSSEPDSEIAFMVSDYKRLLDKHVRMQFQKAKANSKLVPRKILKHCQRFFFDHLDDIAQKVVATEMRGFHENHGFHDTQSGVYLVVSVMPWTTEEAIQKLSEISSEKPFGYINMMGNLFFDNWPAADLTHFFHVLLCLGGNKFQMHTAMGDYGGFPKARRKFTAFPVELLNEEERRIIGLRQ